MLIVSKKIVYEETTRKTRAETALKFLERMLLSAMTYVHTFAESIVSQNKLEFMLDG